MTFVIALSFRRQHTAAHPATPPTAPPFKHNCQKKIGDTVQGIPVANVIPTSRHPDSTRALSHWIAVATPTLSPSPALCKCVCVCVRFVWVFNYACSNFYSRLLEFQLFQRKDVKKSQKSKREKKWNTETGGKFVVQIFEMAPLRTISMRRINKFC